MTFQAGCHCANDLKTGSRHVTQKQEIEICPHGKIVCGNAHNKDDIPKTTQGGRGDTEVYGKPTLGWYRGRQKSTKIKPMMHANCAITRGLQQDKALLGVIQEYPHLLRRCNDFQFSCTLHPQYKYKQKIVFFKGSINFQFYLFSLSTRLITNRPSPTVRPINTQ